MQVILPLEKLAPSEMDLTDLIESLAQARVRNNNALVTAGDVEPPKKI